MVQKSLSSTTTNIFNVKCYFKFLYEFCVGFYCTKILSNFYFNGKCHLNIN